MKYKITEKQFNRIIQEQLDLESEFSPKFRRRIEEFKNFVWNNFATTYPCDFENFTAFMQGINNEIRESVDYLYTEDEPVSNWVTYKEASNYVEKYMIEDLRDFYVRNCKDFDE